MDKVGASIPAGLSAGDYAKVLEQARNDPQVKRLDGDIEDVKDRIEVLDHSMKLPMKDRLQQVPSKYYNDIIDSMQADFRNTKDKTFLTLISGGMLATVATIGCALFGVIPPFAAQILGPMVPALSFGGGLLYLKAAKKWLLPRHADKRLMAYYKDEMNQLQSQKQSYENASKNALELALKKALEARQQALESGRIIEEDEGNIVNIGGVRLKAKPEPGKDVLKFINDCIK